MRIVTPDEAADAMVTHHHLRQPMAGPPATAVPRLLNALRHIQLDPLDVLGTNADLVAMARIDGLSRGDVYRMLMPGHAFEHFAKERCLLPKAAFPWYRRHINETRWWGLQTRIERLPPTLVDLTLESLATAGPATSKALERAMLELGHTTGRVKPMDWSGWKGTSRAVSMALEVLWTRCDVAVVGRVGNTKVWDIAARAFPDSHAPVDTDREAFLRWALLERAHAAGLLSRASGPHWSTIVEVRGSDLADQLVAEGHLEDVQVEGQTRRYLAPPSVFAHLGSRKRKRPETEDDGRMRILGPLDPLLWDRKLVAHAFGFDYVWEVYKPAAQRRWGYYVLPLLHHGRLVGRFEGHIEEGEIVVDTLWKEPGHRFDQRAFKAAVARHGAALRPGA